MKANFLLLALPLAFCACDTTTETSAPGRATMYAATGPATAYPDVEMFGENPLAAFQRTGNQPLPIAVLPMSTGVRLLGRSGSFCQVATGDGRVGWVAASNLTGVAATMPDSSGTGVIQPGMGTDGGSAQEPQDGTGLPTGSSAPDTIDLDRLR